MRILVTGGAGFVGANLVDHLANHGHEIIVFDNLSRKGAERNLEWLVRRHRDRFQFVRGDVRDPRSLEEAMQGVEIVYHLAAQVAVTTSIANPRLDFEVNALGTFNVLEAARKVAKDPIVVFTSTNKVFGRMKDLRVLEKSTRYECELYPKGIPETYPLDFHSPYGCSKGAAEQYVKDYYRIYRLRTVIFRMSCIYGYRQFGNEDQGWVAHFIISSILGRPLTIYGDGKQTRDILFIDDLLEAFLLVVRNIDKVAGEVYNIGGGPSNSISLLELISLLESMLGRRILYRFSGWRLGDQLVYISDIDKARADFGWSVKISKEEGIARLHDWVNDNKHLFQDATPQAR